MKNKELISTLHNCISECLNCANACLNEDDIKKMVPCIKLDRACAETCQLGANLLSMDAKNAEKVIQLCEQICSECGEECAKHDMQHCQDCAKACKECAEACSKFSSVAA